jgi:nucleoid-associated protein YgaU
MQTASNPRIRGLSLLLTAAGAAAALRAWQPPLPRTRAALGAWLSHAAPDQAVVTLAAVAAWGCLGWLAVATLLAVAARLPGQAGRVATAVQHRLTPPTLRRLVEAALGAAVVTGAVGPSLPAAADAGAPSAPSLDRPAGALATGGAPRPADEHLVAHEVVVRTGDTLWGLAARRLGPGAGNAAIAAAWPEWYAANRAVIGADPDLIRPGQRLRPPR